MIAKIIAAAPMLILGFTAQAAQTARPAEKPTLIVAIAVDQFSAGIFDQYRNHYQGGLRRMIVAGVVFPNGPGSPRPSPSRTS